MTLALEPFPVDGPSGSVGVDIRIQKAYPMAWHSAHTSDKRTSPFFIKEFRP